MKNILLLVHDDTGQEARLQAALDVTRAVEGHLNCLDVAVLPVMIGDYWDGAGSAMLLADERTREAANRVRLEQRITQEGVSWSWIDATGELAPCIESAAILNDLIVVNRRLDSFPIPDMRTASAEVIVKSGKPVLSVPEGAKGLNLSGRVLVAWNGSREADTALHAAIPLLKLATHVTLLEVGDDRSDVPAEEAAQALSRHDIHVLVVRDPVHVDAVDETIIEEIEKRHIDYVVMGGFGHSPIREALFGGTTRGMLTASPVPVLFAH